MYVLYVVEDAYKICLYILHLGVEEKRNGSIGREKR
jgi:hypothetical protein